MATPSQGRVFSFPPRLIVVSGLERRNAENEFLTGTVLVAAVRHE